MSMKSSFAAVAVSVLLLVTVECKCKKSHSDANSLSFDDLPAVPTGTGMAHVVDTYLYQTAPGVGLKLINPFLSSNASVYSMPEEAQCANRTDNDPCWEYISLWSSAAIMPQMLTKEKFGRTGHMLGITDRGINGDCPANSDYVRFYVPNFAPAIMDVSFNADTKQGTINDFCLLKDSRLVPVTGAPNSPYDKDIPVDGQCGPLPYDPRALDLESIIPIPGSKYCLLCEEYGPSVLVVDCNFKKKSTCGQVLMRYVPEGSDIPGLIGDLYPVTANLPAAFLYKRPNKGFESISVSPSGNKAMVTLQSALGLYDWAPENTWPNQTITESSHVLLSIQLDVTDPVAATVEGVYVYIGDRMDSTNQSQWIKSTNPKDLKISETRWATVEAGLTGEAAESPLLVVDERAKNQVKMYLTDYSEATNVLPMLSAPGADPLMFDNIWSNGYDAGMAAITALGVTPAKKALLLDTALTVDNYDGSDKVEGVVLINKCLIGMGEDNDFGIGAGPSPMHFIQLPACIDAVYQGM